MLDTVTVAIGSSNSGIFTFSGILICSEKVTEDIKNNHKVIRVSIWGINADRSGKRNV